MQNDYAYLFSDYLPICCIGLDLELTSGPCAESKRLSPCERPAKRAMRLLVRIAGRESAAKVSARVPQTTVCGLPR